MRTNCLSVVFLAMRGTGRLPKLTLHTMDVSFDAIKDASERERFMNMPTSFVLPPDDVDRLGEIGGRLLRESPDFQELVREWGGTAAR